MENSQIKQSEPKTQREITLVKMVKLLLIICIVMMVALAFTIIEVRKYSAISEGEYFEREECMQMCANQNEWTFEVVEQEDVGII